MPLMNRMKPGTATRVGVGTGAEVGSGVELGPGEGVGMGLGVGGRQTATKTRTRSIVTAMEDDAASGPSGMSPSQLIKVAEQDAVTTTVDPAA